MWTSQRLRKDKALRSLQSHVTSTDGNFSALSFNAGHKSALQENAWEFAKPIVNSYNRERLGAFAGQQTFHSADAGNSNVAGPPLCEAREPQF